MLFSYEKIIISILIVYTGIMMLAYFFSLLQIGILAFIENDPFKQNQHVFMLQSTKINDNVHQYNQQSVGLTDDKSQSILNYDIFSLNAQLSNRTSKQIPQIFNGNSHSNNHIRICHISDLHAAFDLEYTKLDERICETTKYPLSSASRIKYIMDTSHCDLRIFTGDLMRGSIYDLEPEIAQEILSFLNITVWIAGNHDFGSNRDIYLDKILSSNSYNSTLVLSNVKIDNEVTEQLQKDSMPISNLHSSYQEIFDNNLKPYKKYVISINKKQKVTICIYGFIDKSILTSMPNPNIFIVSDIYKEFDKVLLLSALDNCLNKSVIRIVMTHIGYNNDIRMLKYLSNRFPNISFQLLLSSHSHLIHPNYLTSESNVALSSVGAYSGYVGVIDIDNIKSKKSLQQIPKNSNDENDYNLTDNDMIDLEWAVNFRTSKLYSIDDKLEKAFKKNYGQFSDKDLRILLKKIKLLNINDVEYTNYCNHDVNFLKPYRNRIENELEAALSTDLFEWKHKEQLSRSCRSQRCIAGTLMAGSKLQYFLNNDVNDIICANSTVDELDDYDSVLQNKDKLNVEKINTDYDSVVSFTIGSLFRNKLPSSIDSYIEYNTLQNIRNGKNFEATKKYITLYDIIKLLPYNNRIRFSIIYDVSDLCKLVYAFVNDLVYSNFKKDMIHPAAFEYFFDINNKFWSSNEVTAMNVNNYLVNKLNWNNYTTEYNWQLSEHEILGIILYDKNQTMHKGYCDKHLKYIPYSNKTNINKILLIIDEYILSIVKKILKKDLKTCWVDDNFYSSQIDVIELYGKNVYEEILQNKTYVS